MMLAELQRGVTMAKDRVQTGIRFEPELLYKLAYVARENFRSMNGQLEFLAIQCVREYEAKFGPIPVDEEVLYKK